jgi:hypothetical protein
MLPPLLAFHRYFRYLTPFPEILCHTRLEPRLGRQKTIVTIARKLLVAVWHVLTREVPDRFSTPEIVANRFMNYVYAIRVRNMPGRQPAAAFTRTQLDRLGIGKDLQKIRHRSRAVQLPLSTQKK